MLVQKTQMATKTTGKEHYLITGSLAGLDISTAAPNSARGLTPSENNFSFPASSGLMSIAETTLPSFPLALTKNA